MIQMDNWDMKNTDSGPYSSFNNEDEQEECPKCEGDGMVHTQSFGGVTKSYCSCPIGTDLEQSQDRNDSSED